MSLIGSPKTNKYPSKKQEKSAIQRKNEELYGKSAQVFGTGKK